MRLLPCTFALPGFLNNCHLGSPAPTVLLQYYLADASMLECIGCGCDGLWGAASPSGAGWGHACTLVTLTNLARLGNPHVEKVFDMPKLYKVCGGHSSSSSSSSSSSIITLWGSQQPACCLFTCADVFGGRSAWRGFILRRHFAQWPEDNTT